MILDLIIMEYIYQDIFITRDHKTDFDS